MKKDSSIAQRHINSPGANLRLREFHRPQPATQLRYANEVCDMIQFFMTVAHDKDLLVHVQEAMTEDQKEYLNDIEVVKSDSASLEDVVQKFLVSLITQEFSSNRYKYLLYHYLRVRGLRNTQTVLEPAFFTPHLAPFLYMARIVMSMNADNIPTPEADQDPVYA